MCKWPSTLTWKVRNRWRDTLCSVTSQRWVAEAGKWVFILFLGLDIRLQSQLKRNFQKEAAHIQNMQTGGVFSYSSWPSIGGRICPKFVSLEEGPGKEEPHLFAHLHAHLSPSTLPSWDLFSLHPSLNVHPYPWCEGMWVSSWLGWDHTEEPTGMFCSADFCWFLFTDGMNRVGRGMFKENSDRHGSSFL